MLLNLKRAPGQYAWRVSVVADGSQRYRTGEWSTFSVVAADNQPQSGSTGQGRQAQRAD